MDVMSAVFTLTKNKIKFVLIYTNYLSPAQEANNIFQQQQQHNIFTVCSAFQGTQNT